MIKRSEQDRFWIYVEKTGDCWNWTGWKNAKGYGIFNTSLRMPSGTYKKVRAHRYSLALTGTIIPDGMVADHLCRNRACVNPAHLEVVTPKENSRRGYFGQKSHCPQGHEYNQINTYVRPVNGHRYCKACAREKAKA